MKKLAGCIVLFALAITVFVLVKHPANAQSEVSSPAVPEVIWELKNDTSPPLREMVLNLENTPATTHRIIPLFRPMPPIVGEGPDAVAQDLSLPAAQVATTNLLNFDGISDRDGDAPPDTNAAVGATQAVETVNTSYQVYDKTTGASVFGPFEINSIWSGFGGTCQTGFQTDPIVLYDQSAGRWVISQIVSSSPNFNSNDNECIAVSTTSDATGSWNRYAFSYGSNTPDYDKIAVWPDAYYANHNIFNSVGIFIGAQACAYNRTAMLAGSPATSICFQRGTSDFSFLPSDMDGATAPPAGEPNFFVELFSSTTLHLFKFHVDFTIPANSTFTGPTTITVASYSEACSGGTCIPQSGTTQKLDSLGDRLMHRMSYRNFGAYESLLLTHSIKASKAVSGARWYEIRSPNTVPVVFQQGTVTLGTTSAWMASIAQDKLGDIAIGFSDSSSAIHPSIEYTGRIPTDTLGTMESPHSIIKGTGSQNGGLNRWGDYSSMAIDPDDDCTFWYAQEYLKQTGSFNWDTRLASFRFNSCP